MLVLDLNSIVCLFLYRLVSQPMKNLSHDNSTRQPQQGPYFSDGQRRVDYVLAYHIRKTNSVQRCPEKDQDNTFVRRLRRSLSIRSSRAPLTPKEDPEIAAQDQQVDYHEDDKRFRREEFEENLLEMGLELEKDEEVRHAGLFFFFYCWMAHSCSHLNYAM